MTDDVEFIDMSHQEFLEFSRALEQHYRRRAIGAMVQIIITVALLALLCLTLSGCVASPAAPIAANTSAEKAIDDEIQKTKKPALPDDIPNGSAAAGPKELSDTWHGLILFTSKSCRFCPQQLEVIDRMPGWKRGEVGSGPLHVVVMDQGERRDDLLRYGVKDCHEDFAFPQLVALKNGERVGSAVGVQDSASVRRLYGLTQ